MSKPKFTVGDFVEVTLRGPNDVSRRWYYFGYVTHYEKGLYELHMRTGGMEMSSARKCKSLRRALPTFGGPMGIDR